jgi:hypothetical protein
MSLLLPGKHTPADESLLHQAELLYVRMPRRGPVAHAWLVARELAPNVSFGRFVLMLDILFAVEAISFESDALIKRNPNAASA